MQRRSYPLDAPDDHPDDYDGRDPEMGGPIGLGLQRDNSGGGPSRQGRTSRFAYFSMARKALSICTMLAVLALECAVAVQDVKLAPAASALKANNSFRKRNTLDRASGAANPIAQLRPIASMKESCGYYLDFDVPAVTAGKARSAMFHVSNALAMFGLIFLDSAGPLQAAQILGVSRWALPPVGNIGLASLSIAQMWLGSSIANHFNSTISFISAYMLITVGLLGLTMSVMFLGKLKTAYTPPLPSAVSRNGVHGLGPGGFGSPGGEMRSTP